MVAPRMQHVYGEAPRPSANDHFQRVLITYFSFLAGKYGECKHGGAIAGVHVVFFVGGNGASSARMHGDLRKKGHDNGRNTK
jgi:hypothetical protein